MITDAVSPALELDRSRPTLAQAHDDRAAAERGVTQQVAAVARATPDAIAIEAGSVQLTYGGLEARANRLAGYLRSLGVGSETPVALCLERSIERIVAKLAILKAGGAFVPLDPTWPEARLRFALDDAGAPVVIAGADQADLLDDDARTVVVLERDAAAIAACPAIEPWAEPDSDALAYIIYTSGSTGTPKGAEISHGNLLNLVAWHRRRFGVTAADRASHLAGLGFDAAVWEIWPYLCAGACVSLASEPVRTSPALLRDWLVERAITIAFVPTPLAEPLIASAWPQGTALRLLLTGGETLHNHPQPGLPFAVINNYGPTECAVVATSGEVLPRADGGDGLPAIGRPIENTEIHLLDERGEPVAAGEIGEIWVGGAGVGRGYRGRPDLTAQCFVPDRRSALPGARLYRTGDLGARLPDGQIAFHGRIDDQEKIRGHRVEPDEIARALNRHPGVDTSAVVARGAAPTEKQLVAYVVPRQAAAPCSQELREFLATSLPDYMIPAHFVRLGALPLTGSGKLDRRALPEPTPDNELDQTPYRAPETPTERRLAEIVAKLLGMKRVGADDNFFLIGGHSLLGTQVVLRAREAFGVEVTLRDLFEAETVANLAGVIEGLLIAKLEAMSEDEAQRRAAN